MVPYFGDFAEDATVYIPINTFDSNDPAASVTVTNLLNTDVHIHKDGGTTQRNNAAGITMTIDFDSITGNHMLIIDTSDDTVAGFWVAGHEYQVRIEGATVDTGTINAWIGSFSIERAGGSLALIKNGTYGLSALNALLAHADYGLAKLVRSTTPANTLTVDANHLVAVPSTQKIDVETIKTQVITCAAGVTVLASVGTAATSTAQTGDSYADLKDGGRLDLLIDAIKVMTDKIGTVINTGGTATIGAILGDFANSDLVTRVVAIKTVIDALDTLTKAAGAGDLAAIKAKTDDLTFSTIGANKQVNAVVKSIVTTELKGDGSATPWGPA